MKTTLMKVAGVLTVSLILAGTSYAGFHGSNFKNKQWNQETHVDQGLHKGQIDNPSEANKLRNAQKHMLKRNTKLEGDQGNHYGQMNKEEKNIRKFERKQDKNEMKLLKHMSK